MNVPQTVNAHKKEDPLVVKYHKRLFKRYTKRADKQAIEIEKHKEMIGKYQKQHFINKKSHSYSNDVEEMKKHCEAIIKASEELKEEYTSFANWHKTKMESLKGK
tara:strand:- start:1075 stop:1389 length:315 start_codon:yes stop_codon:yes gene_type:complete